MSLGKALGGAAILAAVLLAGLFAVKFAVDDGVAPAGFASQGGFGGSMPFDTGRKNYASAKQLAGAIAPGDLQKYEKVATVGLSTPHFDADRTRVDALIAASAGITQFENQHGLNGDRILQLGIGVPPAQFDAFIEDARKIARVTELAIIKTDKTNEYRQLRARRETLEKARSAVTEMAASGGSTEERLKVQAQLTEIEEKVQDLGVALGDFNAENEFCTVKLTLTETAPVPRVSAARRALTALTWALRRFLELSAGLLLLTLALWLGTLVVGALGRSWRRVTAP